MTFCSVRRGGVSLALLVAALLGAISGCASTAPQPTAESSRAAPTSSPRPTPTTLTPTPTAVDDSLVGVTIGVDGIQLAFADQTNDTFLFTDSFETVLGAVTAASGAATETPYAGDPDCGASTEFEFDNGLRLQRYDVAAYAPEAAIGPRTFRAIVSSEDAGSTEVSFSTTTGIALGDRMSTAVENIPTNWVVYEEDGTTPTSAIVESDRADATAETDWTQLGGLVIDAEGGLVSTIAATVGIMYLC